MKWLPGIKPYRWLVCVSIQISIIDTAFCSPMTLMGTNPHHHHLLRESLLLISAQNRSIPLGSRASPKVTPPVDDNLGTGTGTRQKQNNYKAEGGTAFDLSSNAASRSDAPFITGLAAS